MLSVCMYISYVFLYIALLFCFKHLIGADL